MYQQRLFLLSWLVLPLIGVWLATNYLIGLRNSSSWINSSSTGTTSISVKAAASENPVIKTGAVTLWFDDGWYSQFEYAASYLENSNYKAAVSIPVNLVGGETYMTWPQIKKLQFQGWNIASHSVHHNCDPANTKPEEIGFEITESQKILEEKGLEAQIYVTPCGIENPDIKTQVKNNYLALRTSVEGLNSLPLTDPYSLKVHVLRNTTEISEVSEWLHEASIGKSWLILVFHQIGTSRQDYEITPEFFHQVISFINLSELPVVTPSEILHL